MREWLKAGAEIPDDPQLDRQLTSAKYFVARGKVRNGAIVLEAKEDIKKRGYDSPDRADALAMSFAVTIAPRPRKQEEVRPSSWPPFNGSGTGWMS
jgi:phage terminase large subunit